MQVLWTEAERKVMFQHYWRQVKRLNAPRWVRVAAAERLALAHLQAMAKRVETSTIPLEAP